MVSPVKNYFHDERVKQTLKFVYSSKRPLPVASLGVRQRKRSFNIEFDGLTPEIEKTIFKTAHKVFPGNKEHSSEEQSLVLACGEEIMLSAFIITKLGGRELTDKVAGVIRFAHDFRYRHPHKLDLMENLLFYERWTRSFFGYCELYGKELAENVRKC